MWSRKRIEEDLRTLRIRTGDSLILHASMRAVGDVEGGADTVIEALRAVLGPEGTLMVPAFEPANREEGDQGRGTIPRSGETAREEGREDSDTDEARIQQNGILAERIRHHPEASVGRHPVLAFAALGRNAAFLTTSAPFHYPLGAGSPLARLYQLNGGILLMGVDHRVNSTLHLAEVWAEVAYVSRSAQVIKEDGTRRKMEGSPECSAGFARIEPILRQARILREGSVGGAPAQYMRVQHVVSMAVEMLRGDPESLLCNGPTCEACTLARRFTAEQQPLSKRTFDAE